MPSAPVCYCHVCDKHLLYSSARAHVKGHTHKCNTRIFNNQCCLNIPSSIEYTMIVDEEAKQRWLAEVRQANKARALPMFTCDVCKRDYPIYYKDRHDSSKRHLLHLAMYDQHPEEKTEEN